MLANPKWKKFERIVAAVHASEVNGASVKWNEMIHGRQFDVTLRFKMANYEFLVVIECKDYDRPVSVDKVDALATKASDGMADKAVMFSANGFQQGAKEVARRHKISLVTLGSLNKSSEDLAKSMAPILHLSGFRFEADAKPPNIIILPDEIGVMRSLMRDIRVEVDGESISPEELLAKNRIEAQKKASGMVSTCQIKFPNGAVLIHPNTLSRTPVRSFVYEQILMTEADAAELEHYSNEASLSADIVQIRDVLTEETRLVDTSLIDHGFDTVVEAGKFYTNPKLGFSYYVEKIDGSLVTYFLVESYQLGNLMQVQYTQDIKYSTQFVEITDAKEIIRLTEMLGNLQK